MSRKILLTCPTCGKQFERYPSTVAKSKSPSTCSKTCKGKLQTFFKGVVLKCATCGREFTRARSRLYSTKTERATCSHECRNRLMTGKTNWRWKGGQYVSDQGYRMILQDDGTYVQEHRIVMGKILGRKLLDTEVVHHKDGDRLNNSPENLAVCVSHGQHSKEHHPLPRNRSTGQFEKLKCQG